MKNILAILFSFILCSYGFAQTVREDIRKISGTWVGIVEDHPMTFEISENKPGSFILSFINFQNEKFIIQKSEITKTESHQFVIVIKDAKFSSSNYDKCIFSKGALTLSDVSESSMKLNLNSVGPNCFLSYDVIMNMPDIRTVTLTKEKPHI
ncbi:hypothetical protein SD427_17860 [Chryseobacterium sp. JJR-5R]|uniref:hypothetical protein n=1 Tax=Chryseobacterium sp. JJR-5R TaxID=3093923 RepID=UPI002A748A66|nr:hypothetical protein [Chryseobacterium sp. JJR-5R]WPO82604.1 hypothetical protein SD427_17860 [Chryseobacterium sp. JJR-5R]